MEAIVDTIKELERKRERERETSDSICIYVKIYMHACMYKLPYIAGCSLI